MNINQAANLNNFLYDIRKNSNQRQNGFDKTLNQNLNQISSQNLIHTSSVSIKGFNNIFNKIDETIASIKKEGDNEFITQLKHTFQAQVKTHNNALNSAKKATENLNTLDTEEPAKSSFKELSYNISIQNSYHFTIEHPITIIQMSKSMYAILGAWDKDIQEDKKLQTNIAKTIDYLTATYDIVRLQEVKMP